MTCPRPPEALLDDFAPPAFVAAPDMLEWIITTFIQPDGALANEDHLHLNCARLGVLWTNVGCSRAGRTIIGQCEFRPPGGTMGKWQRSRAEAQLHGWFSGGVDFLLTFDAKYAAVCSEAQLCALVEHELYHAGQAKDEFGAPKFAGESGIPVFALRGHDVEEFIGVVKRYGTVTADVEEMVAAAQLPPSVEPAKIAAACGTCHP